MLVEGYGGEGAGVGGAHEASKGNEVESRNDDGNAKMMEELSLRGPS